MTSSETTTSSHATPLAPIVIKVVRDRWLTISAIAIACGACAFGLSFLLPTTYLARTSVIPPQQQQSAAAAAIASLGAFSGLAGSALNMRSPADQYIALLESETVANRMVDAFELMRVYGKKLKVDARLQLAESSRIAVGKKDGLIVIEVEDTEPDRAAAMANAYVKELREMTNRLALTEAQQRRSFLEGHLRETQKRLTTAQQNLEGTGFNRGALRAEPKSAAETFARLQAELTAAEVKLQTIRRAFADTTAEVSQQQALVNALRQQIGRVEAPQQETTAGADYIAKYREYKYQEALYELFSKQYELARIDESRDGAVIQVVDTANAPEKKNRPKRSIITIIAFAIGLLSSVGFLVLRRTR